MLRDSVPQTLLERDAELKKFVDALDDEINAFNDRINGFGQSWDIAKMPDAIVDRWLRAFGWQYKWVADKRLLLKLVLLIYKYRGTYAGLGMIAGRIGSIGEDLRTIEPIVYSPPLDEGFSLSTEYATLQDGWYYNQFTVDIELPPDAPENIKDLFSEIKPVWVTHRFSIGLRDTIEQPPCTVNSTKGFFPGVILPQRSSEDISGKKTVRSLDLSLDMISNAETDPVVTFSSGALIFNFPANVQDGISSAAVVPTVTGTAIVSKSASTGQTALSSEMACDLARNGWSPAVSFLRDDVSFLNSAVFAQFSSVKTEV
ncbi:MAG TPA: hypothetical protein GX517_11715 [Alicyclobacillus sp.]|nr:hypothetical protein [Alicyclobacillus sp.]